MKIKYKTKTINEHLKKTFKDLDFDIVGTTIYARHSYATIIHNFGASDVYISKDMGHTTVQSTTNYLGSFEDDIKKEFANKLTAFKKEKDYILHWVI